MSLIEEVRSVLQEKAVAELKGILGRLEEVERRMDGLEQRMSAFEDRLDKRFDEVMNAIQSLKSGDPS